MSEANNICKQCGGVTGPFAREVVRTLNMLHQQGQYACIGHPEPLSLHDGKLDDRYEAFLTNEGVDISDSCDDHVDLSSKAALSLLAWLRQQENELQQMAQEDKT